MTVKFLNKDQLIAERLVEVQQEQDRKSAARRIIVKVGVGLFVAGCVVKTVVDLTETFKMTREED